MNSSGGHLSFVMPTHRGRFLLSKLPDFVFYFVSAISLGYYYFGQYRSLAFVAYVFCLVNLLRIKSLRQIDIIVLLFLFAKLIDSIMQTSLAIGLLYTRLYWGFLFFYFYCRGTRIDLFRMLLWFAAVAIVEYLLILIAPSAISYLPNYQIQDALFDYYQASGVLGGAHAFGGNRTVSGVLLLAIFCYFDQGHIKGKWFVLIGSLACFSGLAWILAALYLIKNYLSYSWRIVFAGVPIAVIALLLTGGEDLFYRASFGYLKDVIVDYKTDQVEKAFDIIDGDIYHILLGRHIFETESLEIAGYGLTFGDFLFLEFFMNYGIIGCLVFLFFIVNTINSSNFWMTLFILVGTFHYHVAFSMPGQFLLGYFLSRQALKLSHNTDR